MVSINSASFLPSFEEFLGSLSTLTQQIQQGQDFDEIAQGAIANARTVLQTDRVIIYQFLANQDAVIRLESVDTDWPPILGQLFCDPCLVDTWIERYRNGQVTAIADIYDGSVADCHRTLLAQLQVRANLVVPILYQEALWGLLIAHHCRSPRQWHPLIVQYLQHIALNLGLALQQAELRQTNERLTLRLEETVQEESDRQRAEAALQESEERYRSVISTMAEGIIVQEADGRIVACNASAERILGVSPEQIIGQTPTELNWCTVREDGSPFAVEDYPAMITLRTGQSQSKVIMGICREQDAITWISINSHPLFDPSRVSSWAVVTSLADITELIYAKLALRQQTEQRLLLAAIAQHIRQTLDLDRVLNTTVTEVRQFLNTDRVIIFQFAADWSGTVTAESVANGWNAILGRQIVDSYFVETQGEPYEKGLIRATDDIYTAGLNDCHVELLEQLQVRAKLVVPVLQDDRLWGLLVAQHCQAPRHWNSLEIELLQQLATQLAIAIQQSELYQQVQTLNTGLEVQVQERTAQLQQALDFEALLKRITDRVRDSLDEGQILQTVVQALAQGLPLAACDTGIYNADQTTSTIVYEFTNTLTPIQGQTITIATAPHAEVYPQLLRGQICQFSDVAPFLLRPDQRFLTVLAVPIVDDQGVLGDIWLFKHRGEQFDDPEVRLVQQVANQCAIALRQSRLYQAAQAQVQELERLGQLKDDFLSTVSHELRSPMSNIKMATQMLELLLHRMGLLSDESSPLNRYVLVLREEEQREISLINDLLDLARVDAGTEPLSFTSTDLQFYIPHLVETFAERFRQQGQECIVQIPEDLPPLITDLPYLERILTELLHNACKYTPAGETIAITARTTADTLEIRVCNSGVEIPPEERDRIFEKFYRIPNNDPWRHGGTGLGLALVKKIVEHLGGSIWVESGNQQTTFILTFRSP